MVNCEIGNDSKRFVKKEKKNTVVVLQKMKERVGGVCLLPVLPTHL